MGNFALSLIFAQFLYVHKA